MQSGEYRVGKFAADEGALCTLYGLWHKDDRLGYFSDFYSAQVAAEEHAKANDLAKPPGAALCDRSA